MKNLSMTNWITEGEINEIGLEKNNKYITNRKCKF